MESIGGKAIMNAETHERASDRTAEALQKLKGTQTQMTTMASSNPRRVRLSLVIYAPRELGSKDRRAILSRYFG